jgi:hypothetical protein
MHRGSGAHHLGRGLQRAHRHPTDLVSAPPPPFPYAYACVSLHAYPPDVRDQCSWRAARPRWTDITLSGFVGLRWPVADRPGLPYLSFPRAAIFARLRPSRSEPSCTTRALSIARGLRLLQLQLSTPPDPRANCWPTTPSPFHGMPLQEGFLSQCSCTDPCDSPAVAPSRMEP